jgi:thymidylate synthase (FAD)
MEHGSVLEHSAWNFIVTGVSRSFSHELIRHRAGWGYSQLSQRYVDESTANFVEPDIIANDAELHQLWLESVRASHAAYMQLAEGLGRKIDSDFPDMSRRDKRKRAREAARSVLPNATETKIFMTANARALRHFIEYRGAADAEPEIRRVALDVLQIMSIEAPSIFGDYETVLLRDGTMAAETRHKKV